MASEISSDLWSCFIAQSHCWDGWYSHLIHYHSCRDSTICLKQEQVMLLMTVFHMWDCFRHTGSWNHSWGFWKSLESFSGQIKSVNVVRNLAFKSPGSLGWFSVSLNQASSACCPAEELLLLSFQKCLSSPAYSANCLLVGSVCLHVQYV